MPTDFEIIGNDPDIWRDKAEALMFSANVLKRHRDESPATNATADVYRTFAELLLWGYALEAFLKALFLKKDGKLVVGEAFDRSVGMENHDLVRMAQKAGLTPDAQQKDVLARLSQIILWNGRYPIAKKSGDSFIPCYWADFEDDPKVEQIIEAIKKCL